MPPPRLEIDRRTIRMIAISFVLLAGLTIHRLWFAATPVKLDAIEIRGETMGTTYSITLAGDNLSEQIRHQAEVETARRLAEVDEWMSNWNPDSEVARFNAHQATTGFPVSHETAAVVAFAVEISKWTNGAFDITVGPLVRLWGFGHRARIADPPTPEEVENRLRHMGARLLRVGRGAPGSGGFLRKNDPEVEIDLSAIAKGYGVDHVSSGLFALDQEHFLVEIGGEVFAAGERPGGGPWRVAIERPQDEGRAIGAVVELSNQAMATSGDYRIFYREGGRRISHTLDPRTGHPVKDGPASATAIAPTATQADAWATVLMVLGEDGLSLAADWKIAARLIRRSGADEFLESTNHLFHTAATSKAKTGPEDELASEEPTRP